MLHKKRRLVVKQTRVHSTHLHTSAPSAPDLPNRLRDPVKIPASSLINLYAPVNKNSTYSVNVAVHELSGWLRPKKVCARANNPLSVQDTLVQDELVRGSSIVWSERGPCWLPLPASSRLTLVSTEMNMHSLFRPQAIIPTESIAEGMSLCPMQEGGDQHIVCPRVRHQLCSLHAYPDDVVFSQN